MNDSALSLMLESITNLGNRIFAIEAELITYMERNPKGDSSWFEARLRALEEKVKALEHRQDPSKFNCLNNDLTTVCEQKTVDELTQHLK